MRYELSDYEWIAIKPMLPNKPRGVRRVNDRRVLNGIFWVLRSGAPWRDLPENYGPGTTCYNRFVRWRRAGVWDQIMDALAAGHDAAVQMIDTSVVRVHQHGACIADNNHQGIGRSRGGLTSKIHAVVDPMACRSISRSRPAGRMTTGCVRFSSVPCFHKRCYSSGPLASDPYLGDCCPRCRLRAGARARRRYQPSAPPRRDRQPAHPSSVPDASPPPPNEAILTGDQDMKIRRGPWCAPERRT